MSKASSGGSRRPANRHPALGPHHRAAVNRYEQPKAHPGFPPSYPNAADPGTLKGEKEK